jgi:hypothetical protein
MQRFFTPNRRVVSLTSEIRRRNVRSDDADRPPLGALASKAFAKERPVARALVESSDPSVAIKACLNMTVTLQEILKRLYHAVVLSERVPKG